MRKLKSREEKIAEKIAQLLDSLTLDLDQVGKYIGRFLPNTIYNRFMIIAEAAEYEKEEQNEPEINY